MATICPGTVVGIRDTGVDQTEKAYIIDQPCPTELSVTTEIDTGAVCSLSLNTCHSHVATEYLPCGYCDAGTEFYMLFNFNLNSPTRLVATLLDNTILHTEINFERVNKPIYYYQLWSMLESNRV